MRTRETVRELALELVGQVVERLRFTERVVREESLAQPAVAPHGRIADLAAEAHRETAERGVILRPDLCLAQVGVVIVAELVAFPDAAGLAVLEVIIQVVLRKQRVVVAVVAQGELIHVEPVVGAEQVFHLVVVLRAVDTRRQASAQHGLVAERMGDVGREVEIALVGMAFFDHVDARSPGLVAVVVHAEHVVVIHLALAGVGDPLTHRTQRKVVVRPQIRTLDALGQLEDTVRVEAGQVTVVVGARVGAVRPRQGRITVLAEAERSRGGKFGIRRNVEPVVEHHNRLVVIAHARVAQLAVLLAHIGVVRVVTQQVVGFLRRRLLRSALGRCAQDGQRQVVAVAAETLFDRCEVTVGIVVHPVDIGVAALAGREREGVRPSVVEQARSVGNHRAEAVHRVAVHDAGTEALAHLRSARIDIGRTADAVDAVARRAQPGGILLVTRGIVQAAPQRPGAIARHGVVEPDAVQVDARILRIVTAHVETHLAEFIRGNVVEDILRRRKRRRQRLPVGRRIGVELREHGVVDDILHIGGHHHRIEVLDHLVDTDRQVEVLELGGFEFQLVFPFGQLVDIEITVVVGHDGDAERFDDHLDIAQCDTAVTRDDLAFDAPVLGIRPGTGQREQDNK